MKRSLVFGNVPVSNDEIAQMYKMAWHYAIHRWNLRIVDEDVRDIVQEAVEYTAASMSRGEYNPACGAWGTWAYMKVKGHECWRIEAMIRDRSRHADYDINWLSIPADEHDEPMDDDKYIATLPTQHRELASRLLRGDTIVSIARDEGITKQAIYDRKMRLGEWIRGNHGDQ